MPIVDVNSVNKVCASLKGTVNKRCSFDVKRFMFTVKGTTLMLLVDVLRAALRLHTAIK